MKHLVAIFLPLCIFSFIAFGISVAILGTEDPSAASSMTSVSETHTRFIADYESIEINSNAVNVNVVPSDTNETVIFTTHTLMDTVSYSIENGVLYLSFDRRVENIGDFIKMIFGTATQSVIVAVPEAQYYSIDVVSNAGETNVNGVRFDNVDLLLNGGNLVFVNPVDFAPVKLDVELNAGNCSIYNAACSEYDISMNAGNIDVYGLTGTGYLEMNAGNGNFNFADLNGDMSLSASAGNVDVNLPENASATIDCEKSAGNVSIDFNGKDDDIHNNEEYVIGDGEHDIFVEISAGNISISDRVKQKTAPSPATIKMDSANSSTTASIQTTAINTVASSPALDIDLGVLGGIEIDENNGVKVDVGPVEVDVNDDDVNVEVGNIKVNVG